MEGDLGFRELNALLASTQIAASVSGDSNILCIACTAASKPKSCPAHTCSAPAASWKSSPSAKAIALFTIHRIVSPMPIGHTPGFLSSAISRQAVRADMLCGSTYFVQSFLAMEAIAEQRSEHEDFRATS